MHPPIVIAKTRPRLKGDSIEYNTETIRLRVNSNVEYLLAQLPGLLVEPDGTMQWHRIPARWGLTAIPEMEIQPAYPS